MENRRAHRVLQPGIAAAGILSLLLAACSFKPDYSGTEYRCEGSAECPAGQSCLDGVCRAAGPDAGPDAGPVDSPECGTLAAAVQDFTDIAQLDPYLWYSWATAPEFLAAEDGRLVFSIPAELEDVGAAFGTKEVYALKNSAATVEVVELSVDDTVFVSLDLTDQDGRHLHFYHDSGSLVMELDDFIDPTQLASIPYNPAQHRFWRIHEQDGTFYWSTSADGRAYTEHASVTTQVIGPWIGSQVEVWKYATGQQPATVIIDNLNAGKEPVSFCPSASLVDDFDDGTTSANWSIYDTGVCAILEQDGRLGFDFPEASSGECAYESRTFYDLRASTISVEAPLEDVLGIEHCLKVYLSGGQDIEFELQDGELRGEKSLDSGSDTVFRVQFDPESHRYWRFRGDGDGGVFWEVSPDNKSWQVMASHQSPPIPLDYVAISLIGDSNAGLASSVGAAFDNLNVD